MTDPKWVGLGPGEETKAGKGGERGESGGGVVQACLTCAACNMPWWLVAASGDVRSRTPSLSYASACSLLRGGTLAGVLRPLEAKEW